LCLYGGKKLGGITEINFKIESVTFVGGQKDNSLKSQNMCLHS